MSEAKHTPGPWYPVQYGNYWELQDGPYYGDNDLLNEESYKNHEANANLAAAAPDLLEAAIIAIGSLLSTESGYKELKAAIDKATNFNQC